MGRMTREADADHWRFPVDQSKVDWSYELTSLAKHYALIDDTHTHNYGAERKKNPLRSVTRALYTMYCTIHIQPFFFLLLLHDPEGYVCSDSAEHHMRYKCSRSAHRLEVCIMKT
ncbi:hypothetical protein BO99DRAFT_141107 [Aspergillus violaceofuscus CBS 115571]|uniref:Uncharacterized protein n=1 Tax=Aspergillus violaceofuscus (strain CBS 115571) TaxID=1450538 RepID=A0A2V5H5B0_ASPV1|nr:hypothetical protein BO99DRAFT_141107 [Aspergillus violaceofuscus CBS 115571]